MRSKATDNIVKCNSPASLKRELSCVRDALALDESEENWEKIAQALQRLSHIVNDCVTELHEELIAATKGLAKQVTNALDSERSRLSCCATDLITTLAINLGPSFEALLRYFVPPLLSLATRSNKLFVSRAKACLMSIAENSQLPSLLPYLRDAVTNKSISLRLVSTDVVLKCLNCYNPPDLETSARAEDIESIIRATARDANADVRKASRQIFEIYKILLPNRVDAFVNPLTPTTKKYLDVKVPIAQERVASSMPHQRILSASTSALPSTLSTSNVFRGSDNHKASTKDCVKLSRSTTSNGISADKKELSDDKGSMHRLQRPTLAESSHVRPATRTAIGTSAQGRDHKRVLSATNNGPLRPDKFQVSSSESAEGQGSRKAQAPRSEAPIQQAVRVAKRPRQKEPTDSLLKPGSTSAKAYSTDSEHRPSVKIDGSAFTTGPRRVPRIPLQEPETHVDRTDIPAQNTKSRGAARRVHNEHGRENKQVDSALDSQKDKKNERARRPQPSTQGPPHQQRMIRHAKSTIAPQRPGHMSTESQPQFAQVPEQTKPPRLGVTAPTLSQLAKKKGVPRNNASRSSKTVKPLAIRKQVATESSVVPASKVEEPRLSATESNVTDENNIPQTSPSKEKISQRCAIDLSETESESTAAEQSELQTQTVPNLYLHVPPISTPLRENPVNLQLAATPISALLLSIQHGFDNTFIVDTQEDVMLLHPRPKELEPPSCSQ